jgi:PKD repeat protein/pimeloyl-ACP methyl ester carboxylesterase
MKMEHSRQWFWNISVFVALVVLPGQLVIPPLNAYAFDTDHDPVLLIHGFGLTEDERPESTWDSLSVDLIGEGWEPGGVIGIGLPDTNKSADFYTIRLSSNNCLTYESQGTEVDSAVVKILNKRTDRSSVILVGFSMGGLSARAYLQNCDEPRASGLITIQTPHSGSYLAFFAEEPELPLWFSLILDAIEDINIMEPLNDITQVIDSPAAQYLRPCHPLLEELNSNIHKMPHDLAYVNIVSQVPLAISGKIYLFMNLWRNAYEQCGLYSYEEEDVDSIKNWGDGVVPAVSQTLFYAAQNTANMENINWEQNADVKYVYDLQVPHFDFSWPKIIRTAPSVPEARTVIKRELEAVLQSLSDARTEYTLIVDLSPNPIQYDGISEAVISVRLLSGKNPIANETLTFSSGGFPGNFNSTIITTDAEGWANARFAPEAVGNAVIFVTTSTGLSKSISLSVNSPLTAGLTVISEPMGGSIWINNRDTGFATPHTFTELLPGDYFIVVRKDGYLAESRSVRVATGVDHVETLNLTEIPETIVAHLSASSGVVQRGEEIFIDGAGSGGGIRPEWSITDSRSEASVMSLNPLTVIETGQSVRLYEVGVHIISISGTDYHGRSAGSSVQVIVYDEESPATVEVGGDGIDNDQDGLIDEGFGPHVVGGVEELRTVDGAREFTLYGIADEVYNLPEGQVKMRGLSNCPLVIGPAAIFASVGLGFSPEQLNEASTASITFTSFWAGGDEGTDVTGLYVNLRKLYDADGFSYYSHDGYIEAPNIVNTPQSRSLKVAPSAVRDGFTLSTVTDQAECSQGVYTSFNNIRVALEIPSPGANLTIRTTDSGEIPVNGGLFIQPENGRQLISIGQGQFSGLLHTGESYTVSFGPLESFISPDPQVIGFTEDREIVGVYEPNPVDLKIQTVDEDTLEIAGVIFLADTLVSNSGFADIQVQPGSQHSIVFGELDGYIRPVQIDTVVNETGLFVRAVYMPVRGSLQIETSPISGGVLLDGVQIGNGNFTGDVRLGNYLLSFEPVDGYNTPSDTTINLPATGFSKKFIYRNTPPETELSATLDDPSSPVFIFQGTDAESPSELSYSYWLYPLESSYSEFFSTNSKPYYNLQQGDYIFFVKARDKTGLEDPEPAFAKFTVPSPVEILEITIASDPPELQVIIDGSNYIAPEIQQWPEGSSHTISISSLQELQIGTRHIFSSWSDGGTPTHTITVLSSSTNYIANFTTEHYLTVNSEHGSPTGSGWYAAGEEVTWSVTSPTEEAGGTRYVTSTPTGSVVMDAPQTIDIPWTAQYELTINSDHGTPAGSGWYAAGEEVTWSVTSPTEEAGGTRYVTSTPTGSVVMDAPQMIDIPWTAQYELTINSDHGTPVGAGWYASGEEASWSVTSPTEEAGGTRYVTSTPTGSVLMDAPQTIDIPWTTQYELTINLDHGTPVGAGWYAAGEEVPWSVTSPVAEAEGVQRVASPGSGSVVMDSPKTVEVSWTVEYLLTVVSARGDPQGSGWYASGSEATWSVTTPVVEEDGTQYIAESSSGTVVMDGAQRVEVEWTIPPPVAGFQAAPLSGQVSLHVQFTDQSTGTITSWAWDFGDGGKSNEPNPFHTYEQPGAYTVTLMVVGPGGTHTYTPPNPISVSKRCDDTCYGCGTVSECGRYCGPCPPHADFEGTPREGRPPLGVQFTDKSSNADSWAWDFGDSGKSNEPNPFHTYSQQGLYTVSLTANGPGGSDSETKLSYIDTRILLPEAVFSAEQEIGEAPLTVTLANASQNAISYLWTLPPDNRQTSQETPDPFTLDEPGIYPIELQVDGRWNTKDDARISIEVIQARFIRSPDPAKINEVITFTDASIGNFTSWKWDFGDGSGSEETDPVHAYTASGVFTVTLTAGRDEHTSTAQEKITILEPPQADFTVSNVEITAGETVAFTDASTGEIASWTWDFGDEKTSKEPNPTHIYDKSGTYTVTLTVSGPGGTDIEEKENLIQAVNSPPVISPPIADQVEDEDTAIALDLTAHETDAQDPGEGLRWGVVILRGAELLETPKADGGMEDLFTFQPKPNLFGEAQVQFTLTDSEGATDTQEVLLTWEATPDPPSVSNLAPESGATNRPTSLKLSWKGDDPDFGDASSLSYDIRLGQTTPRDVLVARDYKNTSIVIDDLQAGSRYFWQITAQDPSGLTGTGPAWTFTTVADTRSPAILTGPDVSGCTDHSATVRWSTDEKCDSFIEFSLQPDMEGAQSLNLPDQVTSHSVFLADLDPETVYYYRIRSTDTSGNSSVFKEGQFETLDGPDVTPPWIITGPVVSAVSDRSAQVEWETDEDADARIRFGVDNLSKDVSVSELRKIHRILLTDLSSTSTYQYQITATDASGNPTTSARFDFTTLATPDITPPTFTSGPVVTSSLHDQATVEWTTDEASNSQVAFGLADTYGEWVTSDDLVQIHRAKLTHLEPATTYHYQVLSTDVNGNGPLTSDDFTFTTLAVPDRTPPQITAAPMLLERTDRSALISWKTNELADSFVEFGLDTDYGFLAGSGEDVLVHRVKLTNLEPARTYHYRVRSTDPGDNGPTFNRGDLTFRTRATPDELPPLIVSDPFVIASTPTTVTVQWVTDEPSDSRIRYGLDDAYGEEKVLPEDVVVHTIDLSNLSSATQYHFQVESTDASNNGPTFSEDRAFTTPSEPDEDPPQLLSGPTVRNLTATSASVEWITDEPATSILDYGTNRSYELGHIERGERVEVHVVSIAHLEPSTTYHFKVSSTDGSGNSFTTDLRGNKQHSRDHNFHTLREADRHPPVFLEGPIVYPRDEGATVEWLTDESTDYEIVFDTVPTFDSFQREVVQSNDRRERHAAELTRLRKGTAYYYRLTVRDQEGNARVATTSGGGVPVGKTAAKPTQSAGSFVTLEEPDTQKPVILSSPTVTAQTASSLTIEWETDERSDSILRFGASPDELNHMAGSPRDVLQHRVVLTNLLPGQACYYIASSTDPSGNRPAESVVAVSSTDIEVDLTPPRLLEEPQCIQATDSQAIIEWATDELSTSLVEFGADGDLVSRRENPELTRLNRITLTNLEAKTVYEYRASSVDGSNNGPTQSRRLTFQTAPGPDQTRPEIVGDPEVMSRSDQTAMLFWATDELADSFVEFGTDETHLEQWTGMAEDVLEHRITLTNLEPATMYFYRVGSVDRSNNGPTRSAVFAFITESMSDTVPPAVPSGVSVEAGSESTWLTWNANKEPDFAGYNLYRRPAVVGEEFQLMASLLQEPSFLDKGLRNGIPYDYQLTAMDNALSPNKSTPSVIVTGTPLQQNVPETPIPLHALVGTNSGMLTIRNADPVTGREVLTYTFQVSTRGDFSDVVASEGRVPEGSEENTTWDFSRILERGEILWWRARAHDGVFSGAWMVPTRFEVKGLIGDFDGNGRVNFDDFFEFADRFGTDTSSPGWDSIFDLRADDRVDFDDFFIFADRFGTEEEAFKRVVLEGASIESEIRPILRVIRITPETVVLGLKIGAVEKLRGYGLVLRHALEIDIQPAILDGRLRTTEEGEVLEGILHKEPGRTWYAAYGLSGKLPGTAEHVFERTFDLSPEALGSEIVLEDLWMIDTDRRRYRVVNGAHVQLIPRAYNLTLPYPNPFNPTVQFSYQLPEKAEVRLQVYNILGQKIRTLVNEWQKPGVYPVIWGGVDDQGIEGASGMYFIRLEAGSFLAIRKVLLLR